MAAKDDKRETAPKVDGIKIRGRQLGIDHRLDDIVEGETKPGQGEGDPAGADGAVETTHAGR